MTDVGTQVAPEPAQLVAHCGCFWRRSRSQETCSCSAMKTAGRWSSKNDNAGRVSTRELVAADGAWIAAWLRRRRRQREHDIAVDPDPACCRCRCRCAGL